MQEKLPSILLSGAVVGVAGTLVGRIPVVGGCLNCLLYIGAGMLAVWHYTNTYRVTIPGGQGAVMGLLAGIFAAIVGGVLNLLLIQIGVLPDPVAALENSGQLSQMPPEQAEMALRVVRTLAGPLGILIGIFIGGIASLIGGVIGAATFKKGSEETGSDSSEVI